MIQVIWRSNPLLKGWGILNKQKKRVKPLSKFLLKGKRVEDGVRATQVKEMIMCLHEGDLILPNAYKTNYCKKNFYY